MSAENLWEEYKAFLKDRDTDDQLFVDYYLNHDFEDIVTKIELGNVVYGDLEVEATAYYINTEASSGKVPVTTSNYTVGEVINAVFWINSRSSFLKSLSSLIFSAIISLAP